jgi:hypothetical protein
MTAGNPAPTAPPTGRSKILLIITSMVFALWIAALLVMYFKTVYPQRHPATKPQAAPVSDR